LTAFIAVAEIVLGSLLALGTWPVFSAAILGVLLLLFTGFIVKHRSAQAGGCECFGLLDTGHKHPAVGLIRNIIFIVAAGYVVFSGQQAVSQGLVRWSSASVLLGAYLLLVSATVYVIIIQFVEDVPA
jgi:uncharacterized membrane protein YphA (DoxX/SURF4 family)